MFSRKFQQDFPSHLKSSMVHLIKSELCVFWGVILFAFNRCNQSLKQESAGLLAVQKNTQKRFLVDSNRRALFFTAVLALL